MGSELHILTKWEDMVDYGYTALRHYPKSEKHALAQETRHAMWELGTMLERAHAIKNPHTRLKHLTHADYQLARLRIMLRAAHRLRFLSQRKYQNWSSINVELGKMIGGWIATTKRGAAANG